MPNASPMGSSNTRWLPVAAPSGNFSLAEIHEWLSGCVDGLPPHLPSGSSSATYCFTNVAYRSQLQLRWADA